MTLKVLLKIAQEKAGITAKIHWLAA